MNLFVFCYVFPAMFFFGWSLSLFVIYCLPAAEKVRRSRQRYSPLKVAYWKEMLRFAAACTRQVPSMISLGEGKPS